MPERARPKVFASETGASGHVHNPQHLYAPITLAGGAKFRFHAMYNRFITVAERDLMLPRSPTKRLVSHARPGDVTEVYADDWTVELRYRALKGRKLPTGSGVVKAANQDPGWRGT